MILRGFRIKNFRSIIDTEWCDLCLDNITSLIGQNESGKTSILEALYCFYKNRIDEDDIRSSGFLPAISCSFSIEKEEIRKIFDENYIFPVGLYEKINELLRINLTRTWVDKQTSNISLEEGQIIEVFEKYEQNEIEKDNTNTNKINQVIESITTNENNLTTKIEERKLIESKLSIHKTNLDKLLQKQSQPLNESQKKELNIEISQNQKGQAELEKQLSSKVAEIDQCSTNIDKTKEELKLFYEYREILKNFNKNKKDNEVHENIITKIQSELEAAPNEQKVEIEKKIKQAKKEKEKRINQLNSFLKNLKNKRRIIAKVFEGLKIDDAINIISEEIKQNKQYCSKEIFASIVFKALPIFEMFENFSSLLPNKIDIEDIESKSDNVQGVQGVKNFLVIADLTTEDFPKNDENRIFANKIDQINEKITQDFQNFWQQEIGKNNKIKIHFEYKFHSSAEADKIGKPFLAFYIRDQYERLYPKQRSEGVRWFLSFYIQIKASRIRSQEKGIVLLVDEPGNNLHAKAQEDVLKVFEESKNEITIIYATHCPHLLKIENVHRVLGVQRTDDYETSPTEVLGLHKIGSAKSDTFTALYTLMGARLSDQAIIKEKNNVLLEEMSAFYYLTAFRLLMNLQEEVSFLPATGANNLPQLANLFIGWGLDFVVVVDDDTKGREVYNTLKKNLFCDNEVEAGKKLYKNKKFQGIEDIFTKGDFKKYILENESIQFEGNNSDYLKKNQESKGILALKFKLKIENKEIKKEDLAVTTQKNIEELTNKINSLLGINK